VSIRCITFDLDNTLWPIKPVIIGAEKAVQHYIKQNAAELVDAFVFERLARYRKTLLEENPALNVKLTELRASVYCRSLQDIGTDKALALTIAKQAVAVFLKHRNQVQLFEGVEDAIAELSSHYPLGVITNGNVRFEELPFAHYFSFYLSAENVGVAKPDHKIFTRALAEANALHPDINLPEQLCHVGDDLHFDVYGANQAGFKSCWIPFNETLDKTALKQEKPEDISNSKKMPDITIRHLNELLDAITNHMR